MITKPMLAKDAPTDLSQLRYPLLATPKLDGIRCLVIGGKALTRSFKPVPNKFIRDTIEAICFDGMDGEILVQDRDFNQLSGDVRREDGAPDFYYAVFDYVSGSLATPYSQRIEDLKGQRDSYVPDGTAAERLQFLLPKKIMDLEELLAYETKCLAEGYEGVMVRDPVGPYKCGRSTVKEGYLLKVKRFEDAEAMIYGVEEEMENTNEATKDNFGRTERSTHKEGMVPKGRMGKLLVRWRGKEHIEFEIGTGFTADMRQDFWLKRGELIGKIAKFKHQPSGAKVGGKPRFPVFLGFRDSWDL